jgi:formylmethanofuran dehydrogenase subunit C
MLSSGGSGSGEVRSTSSGAALEDGAAAGGAISVRGNASAAGGAVSLCGKVMAAGGAVSLRGKVMAAGGAVSLRGDASPTTTCGPAPTASLGGAKALLAIA